MEKIAGVITGITPVDTAECLGSHWDFHSVITLLSRWAGGSYKRTQTTTPPSLECWNKTWKGRSWRRKCKEYIWHNPVSKGSRRHNPDGHPRLTGVRADNAREIRLPGAVARTWSAVRALTFFAWFSNVRKRPPHKTQDEGPKVARSRCETRVFAFPEDARFCKQLPGKRQRRCQTCLPPTLPGAGGPSPAGSSGLLAPDGPSPGRSAQRPASARLRLPARLRRRSKGAFGFRGPGHPRAATCQGDLGQTRLPTRRRLGRGRP